MHALGPTLAGRKTSGQAHFLCFARTLNSQWVYSVQVQRLEKIAKGRNKDWPFKETVLTRVSFSEVSVKV